MSNVLQLGNAASEIGPVGKDLIPLRVNSMMMAELVLPFVDGSLKFQSKNGFVSLDD